MNTSVSTRHAWVQEPPSLGNQYTDDTALRDILRTVVPSEDLERFEPDLERFGWRVVTEVKDLGQRAEREPPRLESYDAWGSRIDKVVTSTAWKALHDIAAEEGLIATGYERNFGAASRVYQFTKLYLFASSSGLYSCPLAMTDGAARVLELSRDPHLLKSFARLTSRDPHEFWTSGQWMTEKAGGSDVAGGTETLAKPKEGAADGEYELHGQKWFTSAADGEMSLALARCLDQQGSPIPGTRGLALFYVEMRDSDTGTLNLIKLHRLKNKLGTKQLPTAELSLEGTPARRLSLVGKGVAAIAKMINITRLHNTAAAASAMRRVLALARDYAGRRRAFGKLLIDQPLARGTLAWMEVRTRGCLHILLDAARLLGEAETAPSPRSERASAVLRLLTPVAKLFSAKEAVRVCSEGIEFFGGQGYIEDTGLPGILRDAQVLPIWEGATNVLSLDVQRALLKEPTSLAALLEDLQGRLDHAASRQLACPRLDLAVTGTRAASRELSQWVQQFQHNVSSAHDDGTAVHAWPEEESRSFAFSLARLHIAGLMINHAAVTKDKVDMQAAARWCCKPLVTISSTSADPSLGAWGKSAEDSLLAMGAKPTIDGKHCLRARF
ncbi:protein kinase super protein [Cymbomonas tetramitiformis]|uniref:Protein kinase super protein n=1 Tax=Cymbomonas tetramitiformis TaxID=36881 RepID=A0AAE0EMI1_9CHLO|nr:protein kinase super protein [Cymbomonas tetramitiformis]